MQAILRDKGPYRSAVNATVISLDDAPKGHAEFDAAALRSVIRSGPLPVKRIQEESPMSDNVYRVTEIVGTSTEGVDKAIRNGIERAARTLRGLDWFEVEQVRGHIVDSEVRHFQVSMKVGFRLEDTTD